MNLDVCGFYCYAERNRPNGGRPYTDLFAGQKLYSDIISILGNGTEFVVFFCTSDGKIIVCRYFQRQRPVIEVFSVGRKQVSPCRIISQSQLSELLVGTSSVFLYSCCLLMVSIVALVSMLHMYIRLKLADFHFKTGTAA